MKIRWFDGKHPIKKEFTRIDHFKNIDYRFNSPGYKFLTVQVKNPVTAPMSRHLLLEVASKIDGLKVSIDIILLS